MQNQRLFTFGCSMTNYNWPTWADILGYNIDHQNWGMPGMGNEGIFLQMMEAGYKNNIGPNDTVIVMWTFLGREDRYVKDKWLVGSGVHNKKIYNDEWINKYFCERGSLIKELACISSAIHVLNSWGCKWRFLSTDYIIGASNTFHHDQFNRQTSLDKLNNLLNQIDNSIRINEWKDVDVLNTYRNVFKILSRPSLCEFLLTEYNSLTPVKLLFKDLHPTPKIFLDYTKKMFPDHKISNECINWINDWEIKVVNSKTPYNLGWNKTVKRF